MLPNFNRQIQQQLSALESKLNANPLAAGYAVNLFGFDGGGRVRAPANLGAPTSISNAAELEAATVGFQAAFLESAAAEVDPLIRLALETPSKNASESYKWLGDLPQMEEWKNDRIMSSLAAYGWAIENKKWQATLRVKNDDFADDALGLLPTHVAGMAAQARLHPGELIAALLLAGFTTGLAFDGKLFFDTTHETGSNKLAVAFSSTELANARQLLRQQKRFDGKNLRAKGTHLIVGIDNEAAAEKVLTQETLATGESNTNRGALELIVTPAFEAGEWAVADLSTQSKPVLFQVRETLTPQTAGGRGQGGGVVGFMYDETWFGMRARYGAGYWDFRRIVGSKPA